MIQVHTKKRCEMCHLLYWRRHKCMRLAYAQKKLVKHLENKEDLQLSNACKWLFGGV